MIGVPESPSKNGPCYLCLSRMVRRRPWCSGDELKMCGRADMFMVEAGFLKQYEKDYLVEHKLQWQLY